MLTIALVAAIAIGVRLAVQLGLGFYQGPERWEYEDLARSLVAGNGYRIEHLGTDYQAFATPLYAFLLAGTYLLFGDPALGAGVLQIVLGGALAATIYALGLRLDGELSAGLGAALVAVHPGLVIYSTKVHALNLDAVLVVLLVLLLTLLRDAPSPRSTLVYGSVVGMTALERPTLVLFAVAGIASLLPVVRPRAAVVRALVVVALVTALAVLPWIVRNAVVVGRPVLTTTAGEVLWRGNNPAASGSSLTLDGRPILDAAPDVRDLVWGKPETLQSDLFTRLAIQYIVEDPLRAARDTARKFRDFWWFGPTIGTLYPKGWTALYVLYYVGLLALATLGATLLARAGKRWEVGSIALVFLTVSVLQSLFYVEGRHRWQIEGLLVLLAAVPLAMSISAAAARFSRPTGRVSTRPQ